MEPIAGFICKKEIIYKVNCHVTSEPPVVFHVVQSKYEQMDKKNIWLGDEGSMLLTFLSDFLWCRHTIICDRKESEVHLQAQNKPLPDSINEQIDFCSPPCQIQACPTKSFPVGLISDIQYYITVLYW